MKDMISKISEIIKQAPNLIEAEESMHSLMYEFFTDIVGKVLTTLDRSVKETKQAEGWLVKRADWKTVQFMFGPVTFRRTLMEDPEGKSRYPLDGLLGIRKYQRQSPLVEVKVAEMASEVTYRETARILREWTPVQLSHQTVGKIVRQVGKAQAEEDKELVKELEESASLPNESC